MTKKYWLLKSEPSTWSWEDQVQSKIDMWDGVRNYQARNNLMKMKKGDHCFFYHSVNEKSVIGIVEVHKEHYPDPTDKSKRFVAIDVKALKKLKYPVTLDRIKKNKKLQKIWIQYPLPFPHSGPSWPPFTAICATKELK